MASENKTTIPYVRLGNSGLKVSKLILGCMSYGTPEWQEWVLDEKASIEHIKFAYEAGINTFDTADVYSGGVSEEVLGKALREIGAPRESVVILTKVFNPVIRPGSGKTVDPNGRGLNSLRRLGVDYIDVLQCHRFDYDTPIAETMQALHDVVQKGWVRYIGMSSCFAYQFQAMQNYAINNKLTPFISHQPFYNASYREEEREVIPTLKVRFLSRPWNAEETVRVKTDTNYKGRGTDKPDESRKAINERVEEIAKKKGVSMAQVALAWVLANDAVTAPIIGTTKLDSLKELIGALDVKLTPEEKAYIDEPYTPRNIIGHT
ncbi:uncharacterized protein L201_000039 [Kwoniella dendrophila CBS 6074]|uniref:NADP-dependent oxidoreductase domain-containing protein n=1 Tax=Kwoniella dendrophila CBS 6074 TaxID=1295534 RepID=A0AAX4JI80_9TREE